MNKKLIIATLKEMREACGACFRVITRHELAEDLENELLLMDVKNGFGVRCQNLIKELEHEKP